MDPFYSVKIDEPAPLDINDDEQIQFTIYGTAMNKILSTYMYSTPLAGFRELYANAVTACKEAKKKYRADPRIEMRINPLTLEFEMIEYDSTGITKNRFKNVFTVLGKSSNFNGELPGQFGIGMAAYYSLSANMFIESYARNGDKISYLIRSLKTCDNIIKENPVSLKTYGTKIKLKMQKLKRVRGGNLSSVPEYVFEYLKEISRFSGIRTDLVIDEKLPSNYNGRRGTINLGPKDLTNDTDKSDYVEISNKDYRLVGFLTGVFKSITLAGIPLYKPPKLFTDFFPAYHLNIKNERIYMPTVNRESLTDKSVELLNEKLKSDLAAHLGKFKHVKTIEDWKKLGDGEKKFIKAIGQLKLNNMDDETNAVASLGKLMDTHCEKWSDGYKRYQPFEELIDVYPYTLKSLYCLRKYDAVKIASYKHYTVIIPPARMFKEIKKHLPNLLDLEEKEMVEVYSSYNKETWVDVKNLDETYLRVKKNAYAIAKDLKDHYAHNWKIFNGEKGGLPAEKFIGRVKKTKYSNMLGKNILGGACIIFNKDDVKTLFMDGLFDHPHIYLSNQEINELLIASILSGKMLAVKNAYDISPMLSVKYGVTLFGGSGDTYIIESLVKIRDERLRKAVADFYSSIMRNPEARKETKIIVDKLERNFTKAFEKQSYFTKITDLAFSMGDDYLYHWKKIIKMETFTQDCANMLATWFRCSGARWKGKKLILSMRTQSFKIDEKTLERARELDLVQKIETVQMHIENDDVVGEITMV